MLLPALSMVVAKVVVCAQGADWLSIISPAFVAFLLSRVSGVPILDKQNLRRWKDDPRFMTYFRNTPAIVPFMQ